jgi:hypothetical protein
MGAMEFAGERSMEGPTKEGRELTGGGRMGSSLAEEGWGPARLVEEEGWWAAARRKRTGTGTACRRREDGSRWRRTGTGSAH